MGCRWFSLRSETTCFETVDAKDAPMIAFPLIAIEIVVVGGVPWLSALSLGLIYRLSFLGVALLSAVGLALAVFGILEKKFRFLYPLFAVQILLALALVWLNFEVLPAVDAKYCFLVLITDLVAACCIYWQATVVLQSARYLKMLVPLPQCDQPPRQEASAPPEYKVSVTSE